MATSPWYSMQGNIVLSASAGTGKTFAIVKTILHQLCGVCPGGLPVAPSAILAITFTEKAATELRERVRRDLRRLARGGPESPDDPRKILRATARELGLRETRIEDRRFWAGVIDGFDSLTVTTFHGFAQRVIALHADAVGERADFRLAGDEEATVLATQAAHRGVQALLGEEGPVAADLAWLLETKGWGTRGYATGPLRAVEEVLKAHAHGGWSPPDTRGLEAARSESMARVRACAEETILAARDLASACADPRLAAAPSETAKKIPRWPERANELEASLRAIGDGESLEQMHRALQTYREIWDRAPRVSGDWRRSLTKVPDLAARIDATRGRIRSALVGLRSTMAVRAGLPILAAAGRAIVAQEEEKRRRGVLTFSDLMAQLLALISDHTEVRAGLQSRYRRIFVDEAQDSDEMQLEIVRRLATESEGEGHWRAGTLFVVGDRKQSIYRWRGARPEAYEQMCDAVVAGGGRRYALRENRRSTAQLVESGNALFGRVLREQGGGAWREEDDRMEAVRGQSLVPAAPVLLLGTKIGSVPASDQVGDGEGGAEEVALGARGGVAAPSATSVAAHAVERYLFGPERLAWASRAQGEPVADETSSGRMIPAEEPGGSPLEDGRIGFAPHAWLERPLSEARLGEVTAWLDGGGEPRWIREERWDAVSVARAGAHASSRALRRIRPSDIAVLVRTGAEADSVSRELDSLGIPNAALVGAAFWKSVEVADVVTATLALTDRTLDFACVALLRSPLVGVSDEGMVRLARATVPERSAAARPRPLTAGRLRWAGERAKLSDADREAFDRWLALDAELGAVAAHLPVPVLVQQLLDRTRYLVVAAGLPSGGRRVANLKALVAHAERRAAEGLSSAAWAWEAWGLIRSEARHAGAQVVAPAADVVRIFTMHSVKGLEFPVVVTALKKERSEAPVFFLDRFGNWCLHIVSRDDVPDARAPTSGASWEGPGVAPEVDETGNLFYVAHTRAGDHLAYCADDTREHPWVTALLDTRTDSAATGDAAADSTAGDEAEPARMSVECPLPSSADEPWDPRVVVRVGEEPLREWERERRRPFSRPWPLIDRIAVNQDQIGMSQAPLGAAAEPRPEIEELRPPRVRAGDVVVSVAAWLDLMGSEEMWVLRRVLGLDSARWETPEAAAERFGEERTSARVPEAWEGDGGADVAAEHADPASGGSAEQGARAAGALPLGPFGPFAGGDAEPAADGAEGGAGPSQGHDVEEGEEERAQRDAMRNFGRAAHAALERVDWRLAARDPEAALALSLDSAGVPSELRDGVAAHVRNVLLSEIAPVLAEAVAVLPELPVLVDLGGPDGGRLLRGTLDLLVLRSGAPPLILDWKTSARGHEERYFEQLHVYAVAALSLIDPRPAEIEIGLLFSGGASAEWVRRRLTDEALQVWRDRAAARFEAALRLGKIVP